MTPPPAVPGNGTEIALGRTAVRFRAVCPWPPWRLALAVTEKTRSRDDDDDVILRSMPFDGRLADAFGTLPEQNIAVAIANHAHPRCDATRKRIANTRQGE
jgi:hypothetical protein